MGKALGIGGFFFRAENPLDLTNWLDRVLGAKKVPKDSGLHRWRQHQRTTVFAPLDQHISYFDRSSQTRMIFCRVEKLDDAVSDFKDQNIAVDVDPETCPTGRFALLSDPEGNPIQ